MQVAYCQATNAMAGATNLSSYGLVLRKVKLPRLAFICSTMYTCFVNCSRRITAALPFKLDSSNLFYLLIADFKLFLFHLAAQVLNSWFVNVSRSILITRYVLPVRKSCRTSKRWTFFAQVSWSNDSKSSLQACSVLLKRIFQPWKFRIYIERPLKSTFHLFR